jgi:enamine deaminase RidA (YjgF/YER057c/UK114 family)
VTGTSSATTRASTQEIRRRLADRGLNLPAPWQLALDVKIPATLVRVVGTRAYVSGHIPTDEHGNAATPVGKVDSEVDLPTARQLAIRTLLNILASLDRTLGDLDRIRAWCRLYCMVNAEPGFQDFPSVFNPTSELLLAAFGEQAGSHARVAIGVAGLPWNVPVEIEAELELYPE